jgi:Zn ribbon nucleic-acid-binding protein
VRGEIVHDLEPITERQLTVALIFAAGGSGALTANAIKMVMETGVASVVCVRCRYQRQESKVCVFQHRVHVP